jgi:hypothetical protein
VRKGRAASRINSASNGLGGSIFGLRRHLSALMSFLGPSFIETIADMDPGNVATNTQVGPQFLTVFGLWCSQLIVAMLFQALSAKARYRHLQGPRPSHQLPTRIRSKSRPEICLVMPCSEPDGRTGSRLCAQSGIGLRAKYEDSNCPRICKAARSRILIS